MSLDAKRRRVDHARIMTLYSSLQFSMTILLFQVIFLAISDAEAPAPQVPPFNYEIAITCRPEGHTSLGFRTESKPLKFRIDSIKKVAGGSALHWIQFQTSNRADGIDVVATTESEVTPSMPTDPAQQQPESSIYFEAKSLHLASDDSVPLRLHFKDRIEAYKLRCRSGGLKLEAEDAKFGKVGAETVSDFKVVRVEDGQGVYRCDPLAVSAMENGKELWFTEISMRGQPQSIAARPNVLFVKTTGGHSFYIMKDSGELLLYEGSLMKGENASDDVIALWHRDMGQTLEQRGMRGFTRFIKAAVKLNDRRSIPLLIDCIENGFGLNERCAAVAALEKFNGNPTFWPDKFPTPSSYFIIKVGMNKVFPTANAQAERKKWETIFSAEMQKN